MNREKALRLSYYNILNGNLTYNGVAVPISDLKLETPTNLYVLFSEQSAKDNSNLKYQVWESRLTLTIVCKQLSSVSRDILDDVHEQIETLIIGSLPQDAGLQQESGWQITKVFLDSVNYLRWEPTQSASPVVKVITFSHEMIKR